MGASELTASAMALGSVPIESPEDTLMTQDQVPLRNRTGEAVSPFIKGFADSPVAWQILDDEAIERAKREHKLIFLHIGFKACHCMNS
jgi:hypothetical protein